MYTDSNNVFDDCPILNILKPFKLGELVTLVVTWYLVLNLPFLQSNGGWIWYFPKLYIMFWAQHLIYSCTAMMMKRSVVVLWYSLNWLICSSFLMQTIKCPKQHNWFLGLVHYRVLYFRFYLYSLWHSWRRESNNWRSQTSLRNPGRWSERLPEGNDQTTAS